MAFRLVLYTAKVSKEIQVTSDSGMIPLQGIQDGYLLDAIELHVKVFLMTAKTSCSCEKACFVQLSKATGRLADLLQLQVAVSRRFRNM